MTGDQNQEPEELSEQEACARQLQQLLAMPIRSRIEAVAKDVFMHEDKFRDIEAHKLAELLEVPSVWRPDGTWEHVYFVPREPIESILDRNDDEYDLLRGHVEVERYEELRARAAEVLRRKSDRKLLDLFSDVEKHKIENLNMKHEADQIGGATCVAYYSIETPQGRKLTFEAFIEDDGGCANAKTPYDERDGSFTDLSECLLL